MLFLRTFGGLSLENGGRPLTGAAAQRRPLAVLAAIAVAGEKGLSRDRLQSLFWPDSDEERARGSLKQVLYAFRRDVNEDGVTVGTVDLRLNPSIIRSDIGAFRAAVAANEFENAVGLYTGKFLDGLQFKDLDEFARWVERERGLVAGEYRTALEKLARAAAQASDHSASAKWWGKLVADDPYASRIALAYMRALAAANEREAAIRHGDVYSLLIRKELEAEPDPAITDFVAELRANGGATNGSHDTAHTGSSSSRKFASEQAVSEENSASMPAVRDVPPSQTAAPARPDRARLGWFLAGGLSLIAVAIIGVGVARDRASASTPAAEASRLVVIPFENRTGNPSLDALGSMGADWITDGLARSGLVPVADPATAAAAVQSLRGKNPGEPASLAEIARLTGATRVVSGSFYRRSDSLEFHARISDPASGKILGAIEPVVVSAGQADQGVERLRQQTLSLLAKLLDFRLSQVVMSDTKPPAFAAYKEFVAGVDLQARRSIVESNLGDSASLQARAHFRRAYALDTTFVSALVWALHTYVPDDWPAEGKRLLDSVALRRSVLTPLDRHAVNYFQASLKADGPASLRAAKAASELAPRSQWSWMAGQMIFPENRPREVLKYFDRLDPDHGWMRKGWEYYWYLSAQAKHMLGDLDATHRWLKRARIKFPDNVPIAAAYARSLALIGPRDSTSIIVDEILRSDIDWKMFYVYSIIEDLRRHKLDRDVDELYRQTLSWYQAQGDSTTEADRRYFGQILFSMKMVPAARKQFSELLAEFPKSTWKTHYTGHLAVMAAMQGDSAAVQRLMHSVPKTIQQWPGENTYWRARVASHLGRKNEAVTLLQSAFVEGYPQVSLSHSTWHEFPTLQGYGPFEALVTSDR